MEYLSTKTASGNLSPLPILTVGNTILFQKSAEVDLEKELFAIQSFIDQLMFTLDYGIVRTGIASPQVGMLKRIVIFRIQNSSRSNFAKEKVEEIPLTVMINPVIYPIDEQKEVGIEACLSVPDQVGKVERFKNIEYTYYDREGVFHKRTASGFHARVVQHECDHLDGILFIQRMEEALNKDR